MKAVVDFMNGLLWSNALIYLLLGAGLYFSVRTGFLQIRHFKDMLGLLTSRTDSDRGISSFKALMISISGRVGTGNIAGVATAIALGGPGSVFWMWLLAFLGSATAFTEATLAQTYKEEIDGEYRGGPAYYITRGLNNKIYGTVFAIAVVIACSFCYPGVQSNSISAAMENAFGINKFVTGLIIVIPLAMIIFGGVRRIGKVAQIVVPFMAVGYLLVALIIIVANLSKLPAVIALIFKSAFALEPAFAGIVGMAISMGVKRGIYSNEAGMGTSPQAMASAEVSHPAKQGLVSAFSVYIDTLVVCSATAFIILITNSFNVKGPDGAFLIENIPGVEMGPGFSQTAVTTLMPSFGSVFVALSLFFFAFTTLMAIYYYGETNIVYLFKKREHNRKMIFVLRIVFLCATFYGATKTAALAWAMGDVGAGLMSWLNVVAILLLSNKVVTIFKDYEKQKKSGQNPEFDPESLGIENTAVWKNRINH